VRQNFLKNVDKFLNDRFSLLNILPGFHWGSTKSAGSRAGIRRRRLRRVEVIEHYVVSGREPPPTALVSMRSDAFQRVSFFWRL
jgi:hypothetical protein